jgi:outer membrane exchange protein TraA
VAGPARAAGCFIMLRRNALALTALLLTLPQAARAAPVEIPTAVADAPAGQGQGLCVATAVSTNPTNDFPQQVGTYNAGLNAFIEVHKADRVEFVQRTIFDLSNNITYGTDQRSYGDFTDSMLPTCQTGGCAFLYNDTSTHFGSRFRGFLKVTPDLVATELHLGFFLDDAASLVIYDKAGNGYQILTQPPNLGFPTWRMTQEVRFDAPGLYPLEILYAQIGEHAALEMSWLKGAFTDFQRAHNDTPVVSLKDVGFTLFQPAAFFQTISGSPSYTDPSACKQCDRQFVGHIGNNGCDASYYCNEAALCAPCDTAYFCGPSCSPCGGETPFCINGNGQFTCASCRDDGDCKKGFSCDQTTHQCNECNVDPDCPRGKTCLEHTCQDCATPDKCAGSSCNCCGKGDNGKQMACTVLEAGKPPECVACQSNADCGKGVCDVNVGQCVDALPAHETQACCGDECLKCPDEAPLCLPGPYGSACAACRNDLQCSGGYYCRSGSCQTCTTAHRCGVRCETCAGETPFCLGAQRAEDAKCVRCLVNDDCGAGGKCDAATHTCKGDCPLTCGPDAPFCNGEVCVECYADTQCPCNGTCDLGTNKCSSSCRDNGACLGDQHCHYTDDGKSKECSTGALPDNADCGGTLADLCTGSTVARRGKHPTPGAGALGLSLLALILRRLWRARK